MLYLIAVILIIGWLLGFFVLCRLTDTYIACSCSDRYSTQGHPWRQGR
jgi:hypothetical protein